MDPRHPLAERGAIPSESSTGRSDHTGLIAPFQVAIFCVILAAVGTFCATLAGPGLSPDSLAYFSSGLNLARGNGLHTFSGMDLTMFPPGLPLLIAAGDHLGIGPGWTLRILNTAAAAGIVWLAYRLIRRHVCSNPIVMVTTLFVAVNVALLDLTKMALSEALFVFVSLAFLVLLERVVDDGTVLTVAALIISVWIAFLLRYAGITLIPVGLLVLLATFRKTGLRVAASVAAAFTAGASVVPVLVMLRNHSVDGSLMGPRNPSLDGLVGTVGRFTAIFGRWVAPDPVPRVLQAGAGVALAAVVVAFVVWLYTSDRGPWERLPRRDATVESSSSLAPLAALVVVYSIYLIAAQVTVAFDPINSRLMSPLVVPAAVLFAVGFETFMSAIPRSAHGGRPARTGVAVILAIVLFQAFAFSLDVVRSARDGVGYAERSWQNSEVLAAAATVPKGTTIYSNAPAGAWAVLERQPIEPIPAKRARRSDIELDMPEEFLTTVGCGDSYLIWSDSAARGHFFTPRELRRYVNIEVVAAADDGTLYKLDALPTSDRGDRC